jgi:predicted Zn-dependent protease
LKQARYATYSFNTASKELISANIVFDKGDKWFISSIYRCGGSGISLDIMNLAMHEIGHAIGLGHVNDKLLTMYLVSMAAPVMNNHDISFDGSIRFIKIGSGTHGE